MIATSSRTTTPFAWALSSLSSTFRKGSALGSFPRVGLGQATKYQRQSPWVRRSKCTRTGIVMMPEGPEVRTLVDQLQPAVGRRLTDVRFLSGRYVRHGFPRGFDDFRKTMTNHKVDGGAAGVDVVKEWNAKGKFIWMVLDDGARKSDFPATPRRSSVAAELDDHDGNRDVGHDRGNGSNIKRSIWITLGMSGRFVSESNEPYAEPYNDAGGARWYLEFLEVDTGQTRRVYYHDNRNFGTIRFSLSRAELEKKLQSLGPDILDKNVTEENFLQVVERERNPHINVCKFLMDQKKLCGVGNYILAEGLYRARIDPFAAMSELDEYQRRTLFRELQSTALESYDSQGMTRPGGSYRDVKGNMGRFSFELQCYGRDVCPRGNPVRRETDGPHGRTIWYTEEQLFVPRAMRAPDGRIIQNSVSAKQNEKLDAMATATELRSEADISQYSKEEARVSAGLAAGITDTGWKEALGGFLSSGKFADLERFIQEEKAKGATIYPPEEEIFSALNLCPLDHVKVIIVGQDPYHGPGQGHGLAFSVRKGVRPPPSLKNIFHEVEDDEGIEPPEHGNLEGWAEQGVLLLNAVLTVRHGEANSHARKGWEEFTDRIIEILNDRKDFLVFLLWGGPAAKKANGVDDEKHFVIKTSHPSPLGATKTKSPFLGSKCFSRANSALVKAGMDPIDWNVY